LKTTYYLRAMARPMPRSRPPSGQLNAVPAAGGIEAQPAADEAKFCAVDSPDCEACQ